MSILNPFADFRHPRLDANEGLVFSRQLQQVSAVVNRHEYPALKAREFIPPQPDGKDPLATTYNYHDMENVGAVKAGSQRNNSAPLVNLHMSENESRIRDVTAGYEYTEQEVKRAARAGISLSPEKGLACREVIETEINNVLLLGDGSLNIPGLLDGNQGIATAAVPNGAGGNPQWNTKTPAEILADVEAILTTAFAAAQGKVAAYKLAMPPTEYGILSTTRLDATLETTILAYMVAKLPLLAGVTWIPELATSGAGTTGEMVLAPAGAGAASAFHAIIPEEYTEAPPYVRHWSTEIAAAARTGGCVVRKPFMLLRRSSIS
jgi:hypothetical protein